MTRGQESLGIDLDTPAAQVAVIAPSGERVRLIRIEATPEEVAAHEQVLESIRKESKGKLVWSMPNAAPG